MSTWINACGRPTAIRFNPKTHDTCDVQLQWNVNAAVLWDRALQFVVSQNVRNSRLQSMRMQAAVGKPLRKLGSKWQWFFCHTSSFTCFTWGMFHIYGECYNMQTDQRHCVHWTLWVSSWRWTASRSVWDGFALKLRGILMCTHSSWTLPRSDECTELHWLCNKRLIHSSSSQHPLTPHNYLEN